MNMWVLINKVIPFGVYFFITLILEWIIFRDLDSKEFIFSSDQLFWFSYHEAFQNFFFVRKMDHLGVFNSWQLVVQFWDTVLYLLLYQFSISLQWVEKVVFFITFYFSLSVSFIGFQKLYNNFFEEPKNWAVGAITIWYCLNPYTLIMWHGGVYNFGFALTYALAPLLLYYFHTSVFAASSARTKFVCALILFFSSFVFWLFAVIVFVYLWYVAAYVLMRRDQWRLFLKNISIVTLMYLPLASVVIFLILHEFLNNTGDLNTEFLPTFQNQLGGLWYQFLMIFSWGIYTVWKPRTMFPFGEYFLSLQYIAATVALYGLVVLGMVSLIKPKWNRWYSWLTDCTQPIKKEAIRFVIIFLGIAALSIFFAKASQKPFGGMFLFLYEHVPFFSVFRSADHRFGFGVVFAVAILLLIASHRLKQVFFAPALLVLILIQSLPIFTGAAHRGQEIVGEYFDRIIHIPEEYQELADFMNSRSNKSSYVLVDPAVQYGRYVIDARLKEEYVGQDLLPKLIQYPFVYASTSTGMSKASEDQLESLLQKKQYADLRRFPIRYVITRSNTPCDSCSDVSASQIQKIYPKIFQNKYFNVYEITEALPIVSASKSTFRMVNPTRFEVWLRHVPLEDTVDLALSYHPLWRAYPSPLDVNDPCVLSPGDGDQCSVEGRVVLGDEWRFLLSSGTFTETHVKFQEYGNSWTVDAQFVRDHFPKNSYRENADGTLDIHLTLFYQPQAWFMLILLLSCVSVSGGILFFWKYTLKKPVRPRE